MKTVIRIVMFQFHKVQLTPNGQATNLNEKQVSIP